MGRVLPEDENECLLETACTMFLYPTGCMNCRSYLSIPNIMKRRILARSESPADFPFAGQDGG